jgi:hypothetical protein
MGAINYGVENRAFAIPVRTQPASQAGTQPAPQQPPLAPEGDRDGYLKKVAKYIPAEVLAVFVTLALLIEGTTPLWVLAGIALLCTPAYVWVEAKQAQRPPRGWRFVLAPLAFAVWAIAATKVSASLLHLSAEWAAVILAGGVLIIPAVDEACLAVWPGDRKKQSRRKRKRGQD